MSVARGGVRGETQNERREAELYRECGLILRIPTWPSDHAQCRQREEYAVKSGQQFAGRDPSLFGPRVGVGLVQVLDREGLVIEGLPEFERRLCQPLPGLSGDLRPSHLAPTAILLHLAGHDRTAVGRAQRLKTTALGDRADGQVPAAVGRYQ